MLSVTAVCAGVVMASKPLRKWLKTYSWTMYICLVVMITLMCMMVCCKQFSHKVPCNYIMLGLYTLVTSFLVMTFTAFFNAESVFFVMTMVVSMVVGLTILALMIKKEMFWIYGLLATAIFATIPVIIFNVMNVFSVEKRNAPWGVPILVSVFGYIITCIAGIYIVWDVDVIFHRLSIDEYVVGALVLYSDIITLFLYILT